MDPRRTFRSTFAAILAIAALALLSACSTVGALLGDDVRFTPMQLQHSLDRNFPKHYDKLGGLISLTLMNPRLTIPQDGDRLRLDFDLGLGALGSDSSKSSGHFALTSALRFDPSTRGLHLQDPRIEQVEVAALGGAMNTSARALLNSWLADYAREEPV